MIGTHRDSVESEEELSSRVDRIEGSFVNTAFFRQIMANPSGLGKYITCVDNKEDDDEVFEALCERFFAQQSQLAPVPTSVGALSFDAPYPFRWLRFQDVLLKSGKERMSLEEAVEKAAALGITDEQEVKLTLRLFTEVGLLMHFDEPGLGDLVVIQPQWLLCTMRDLICTRNLDEQIQKLPECRNALSSLRQSGRMLEPDVIMPAIWGPDTDSNLEESEQQSVLAYMCKFCLCCKLDPAGTQYAVPSLFARAPAEDAALSDCWDHEDTDKVAVLCCIHGADHAEHGENGSKYLPTAMFHSIVAKLIETNVDNVREQFQYLYRDRVIIASNDAMYVLRLRRTAIAATSSSPLRTKMRRRLEQRIRATMLFTK